jgi:hypothetical protein
VIFASTGRVAYVASVWALELDKDQKRKRLAHPRHLKSILTAAHDTKKMFTNFKGNENGRP